MTSGPPLLCIGNITIDDAHLPNGVVERACLGGDAVYAVLGARLFDPEAEMLAPIGSALPPAAFAALGAAGLRPEEQPIRDTPTIRNVVTYHADGGRSWQLLGDEDDFDALSVREGDLTERHRSSTAALVAAMSLEAQTETVAALAAAGVPIYLDLQEDYIAGNEPAVEEMIARSTVFLPSEDEARQLSGGADEEGACLRFAAMGPRTVVIKLAERGCLVYADGVFSSVGVLPAALVDSTGAGDAFCGAFAAVHARSGDAVLAAHAGAVAASFAVEGFGASALLLATPDAAAERLRVLHG
jgi:sugar/nucleoside kinase (ribokinase family)